MTATRRLAAILAADVVGYSRLMGEDEAGTARAVREHREAARPIVASYGGRIVKTTGDGLLLEFPSVVAAVECAIAIQKLMVERNAETAEAKRIVYRIGVHLGDVVEEADGDLWATASISRLASRASPSRAASVCRSDAYRQVKRRLDLADFSTLATRTSRTSREPIRVYSLEVGAPAAAKPSHAPLPKNPPRTSRSSSCRSPTSAAIRSRSISSMGSPRA